MPQTPPNDKREDASSELAGRSRTTATVAVLFLSTLSLLAWTGTFRSWLQSGAALASLLVVERSGALPPVKIWLLLALLNATHLLTAPYLLLHAVYAFACWTVVIGVCLARLGYLGPGVRSPGRRLLTNLHFSGDRVVWLDVPMLDIDVAARGWLTVGHVSFSMLNWTLSLKALEMNMNVPGAKSAAIYIQDVDINLFRAVVISPVYMVIKHGPVSIPPLDDNKARDTSFTGVQAESEYRARMEDIDANNRVATSQRRFADELERKTGGSDQDIRIRSYSQINTALRDSKSPSRTFETTIRLTTLQRFLQQPVVRYVLCSPWLVRITLFLASHSHPVEIVAVCASIPGSWIEAEMSALPMFEQTSDPDTTELKGNLSDWLSGSDLHVQLLDLKSTVQVPIRSAYDMLLALSATRTLVLRASNTNGKPVARVVNVAGLDARVTLPSIVLPGRYKVNKESLHLPVVNSGLAQGDISETVNVTVGAHFSLPAIIDKTLLSYLGELVKAGKWMEAVPDDEEQGTNRFKAGIKSFNEKVREKALQGTERVMKGGANDDWTFKIATKLAATLETASGDLGYTRTVRVQIPKLV